MLSMLTKGGSVWFLNLEIGFGKERFPVQRHNKLLSHGDGPFQVVERINDNAYKFDFSGEYGVSATFNVADLNPFDIGDDQYLRTNPF